LGKVASKDAEGKGNLMCRRKKGQGSVPTRKEGTYPPPLHSLITFFRSLFSFLLPFTKGKSAVEHRVNVGQLLLQCRNADGSYDVEKAWEMMQSKFKPKVAEPLAKKEKGVKKKEEDVGKEDEQEQPAKKKAKKAAPAETKKEKKVAQKKKRSKEGEEDDEDEEDEEEESDEEDEEGGRKKKKGKGKPKSKRAAAPKPKVSHPSFPHVPPPLPPSLPPICRGLPPPHSFLLFVVPASSHTTDPLSLSPPPLSLPPSLPPSPTARCEKGSQVGGRERGGGRGGRGRG